MNVNLPEKIQRMIDGEVFSLDDVGMSDSTVILFKDKVLKIQTIDESSENEHNMMGWLKDKLPVPEVLGFERQNDKNFLLMSKVAGEMSCVDKYMKRPELLTMMLTDALKMLWRVDISDCPYTSNLEKKLEMAHHAVEYNLVDMDNVEPDTFGENGFKDQGELLDWLLTNRPTEELVLSHGDFCLPNIFFEQDRVSGFIDLGRCGIADKWQDIALCYRSLRDNFGGRYSGEKYDGFYAELLFEKLGIEPDWEKIKYYILLDELF